MIPASRREVNKYQQKTTDFVVFVDFCPVLPPYRSDTNRNSGVSMHPTQRQSEILREVRLRGTCAVADLAQLLSVSEETIRRDVRPLSDDGLVHKVHGAIVLPDRLREPPFQRRMLQNREEKQRIATALAREIPNGSTLMMDTGSSTSYVAQALCDHSELLVVTNSADIARTLATRNGNRVMMAGGELRADDAAAFGSSALDFVRQFTVQFAILSVGAIDAQEGLMDFHLCEAEFSRAIIGQAERVFVAADHTKFGRKGFVKICELDEIDTLVTSAPPPDGFADMLAMASVRASVAT